MRLGRDAAVGRLTRRAEFLAVAQNGRRFHTARMSLQGWRREAGPGPASLRVGLTITKKSGHATERNRIRRRLRSAVAAVGTAFASEPADVVVIGRSDILAAPFATVVDDLARGLAAVTRLKKPGSDRTSGDRSRGEARAQV